MGASISSKPGGCFSVRSQERHHVPVEGRGRGAQQLGRGLGARDRLATVAGKAGRGSDPGATGPLQTNAQHPEPKLVREQATAKLGEIKHVSAKAIVSWRVSP